MKHVDHKIVEDLHQKLYNWYLEHGRSFPWRETSDPYKIVISEMMLQQTQTSRVLPKYLEFLHKFPTWGELANASQGDVIRAWQGLGYNSRAMRLHMLAKSVVNDHKCILPNDIETLMHLPGIGPYTAGAVMVFAFRKAVPFYDVNIKRVLSRYFYELEEQQSLQEKDIKALVEEVYDQEHPYEFFQTIMDIGATMCLANSAICGNCPLRKKCKTRPEIDHDPLVLRIHRTKKNLPKKIAFKDSKRFRRGKIIDILRDQKEPISETHLFKEYKVLVENSEKKEFMEILNMLKKEGLVFETNTKYHL